MENISPPNIDLQSFYGTLYNCACVRKPGPSSLFLWQR